MLELGGNIYFTAKLAATDGHSFQHIAAIMTGSTQDDYAKMMLEGGRSVEGNRSKSGLDSRASPARARRPKPESRSKAEAEIEEIQDRSPNQARKRGLTVARIIAGVATSHVPAIGAALDNGKTEEPYWKPVFSGFEQSKQWIAKTKARCLHRGLQRPCLGLFARCHSDLCARLRGGISARRRRLGPAPGAGREGPSGACLAHRAVGHAR